MSRQFVQPTDADIAVRDAIASISMLDTGMATAIVVSGLERFRAAQRQGHSAEAIAFDYHLRNIVGLNRIEAEAVLLHLKSTTTDLRKAVSDFSWMDFEQMRDALNVHTLQVKGEYKFYTGRAGETWVSDDRHEAFVMSASEAERKAVLFNERTLLHGLTFVVI